MPKINFDLDVCLVIALDNVSTQQELICVLMLIQRELLKGKCLWKEFFRQKVEQTLRRNVKFDKNIEERVDSIYEIINRESFSSFTKKLEAFRN